MPTHFLHLTAARDYICELEEGIAHGELHAMLDTKAGDDLDLAVEQLTLALTVALATESPVHATGTPVEQRAVPASDALGDARDLIAPALACVNTLLNNPYSPLWEGDDGKWFRRKALVLRARLHRALLHWFPEEAR